MCKSRHCPGIVAASKSFCHYPLKTWQIQINSCYPEGSSILAFRYWLFDLSSRSMTMITERIVITIAAHIFDGSTSIWSTNAIAVTIPTPTITF
ncbi:MAG: hypothetical protein KHX00_00255 [Bacteroides sp.]|nr:hypothetical protein [Bacteroides sp.]